MLCKGVHPCPHWLVRRSPTGGRLGNTPLSVWLGGADGQCCADYKYHNLKNIQNGLRGEGQDSPQSNVTLLFLVFSMLLVIFKINLNPCFIFLQNG